MNLYKYAPAHVLRKILKDQCFSIKFDYPKHYNDPLELFLTPKGVNDEFVFAYYYHLLGQLPQLPTTCFSRRPDVLPMWAHYANNHSGFVIEIDESKLIEYFEAGFIHDVEYKDQIGFCDVSVIEYAARTMKPRHVHRAQSLAFRSAYFTKSDHWSYEMERRLVLEQSHFKIGDSMLIRDFPSDCITAIIAGCRTDDATLAEIIEASKRYGCSHLQLRLGKSLVTPYFIGDRKGTCVFDGSQISPVEYSCGDCGDPMGEDELNCKWCNMTEEMAEEAALSDPRRLFAIAGLPNPYGLSFAGITPVGSRFK